MCVQNAKVSSKNGPFVGTWESLCFQLRRYWLLWFGIQITLILKNITKYKNAVTSNINTYFIVQSLYNYLGWKYYSVNMANIDMKASYSCCKIVLAAHPWCEPTTLQRCSIEFWSVDCGGRLSKVNSLSCSRKQLKVSWALRHGLLSCWK